jgi:anti-sigma regulatory factor (Ser/Thr protein kinase)
MVVNRSARERRSITIRSDVDGLADVRSFVRDAVDDFGGSKRVADDLVQAVDEATCNVMLHGYAGQPGEIEIEAAVRDRRIQFRILDRARPFDPTAGPIASGAAPARPTGPGHMGVGVQLLRAMTDEVHHARRPDGGNELTLVRSIDAPEED